MNRPTRWAICWILALAPLAAGAQSVANGKTIYGSICVACHGFPPAGGAQLGANNPTLIRQAINGLVPDMRIAVGPLNLSDAQLADVAAYIASVLGIGTPPPTTPPVPDRDYSDLWWNENESGWGLNIAQHSPSNNIFAVMYTYGLDKKPAWFILPGGTWTASNVFTGSWYSAVGPAYSAVPFNSSQVSVSPVGSATLTFTDATHATFTFSVNGETITKPISRQPF